MTCKECKQLAYSNATKHEDINLLRVHGQMLGKPSKSTSQGMQGRECREIFVIKVGGGKLKCQW